MSRFCFNLLSSFDSLSIENQYTFLKEFCFANWGWLSRLSQLSNTFILPIVEFSERIHSNGNSKIMTFEYWISDCYPITFFLKGFSRGLFISFIINKRRFSHSSCNLFLAIIGDLTKYIIFFVLAIILLNNQSTSPWFWDFYQIINSSFQIAFMLISKLLLYYS